MLSQQQHQQSPQQSWVQLMPQPPNGALFLDFRKTWWASSDGLCNQERPSSGRHSKRLPLPFYAERSRTSLRSLYATHRTVPRENRLRPPPSSIQYDRKSISSTISSSTRSTNSSEMDPDLPSNHNLLSSDRDSRRTSTTPLQPQPPSCDSTRAFPSLTAEAGFCLAICLTQFLSEYLITGFALELPRLLARWLSDDPSTGASTTAGLFWPASLLTLILSALLLLSARCADKYGGYCPFHLGTLWLGIWTLVAGFAPNVVWLDVCRAMQGLAIAAFTPATFVLLGELYPPAAAGAAGGSRKNVVLGMYAGSAPLGFFAGFIVAGALPAEQAGWYFWVAAVLSFLALGLAAWTIPLPVRGVSRTRREMPVDREGTTELHMDWLGAFFITAGLLLVCYALAVLPYLDSSSSDGGDQSTTTRLARPIFLGPFLSGLSCLFIAVYIERYHAPHPLLPKEFFQSRDILLLTSACLFFYGSYGVWLYDSALFLQLVPPSTATTTAAAPTGVTLALYYLPTALGGILLCLTSGFLLQHIRPQLLLFLSGIAWVIAPLLLAVIPSPTDPSASSSSSSFPLTAHPSLYYYSHILPSMLCATAGIDLTFTVSLVVLTRLLPARVQGLAGALASICVNLAVGVSLSLGEIVRGAAVTRDGSDGTSFGGEGDGAVGVATEGNVRGFRAAFWFAVASAGVGVLLAAVWLGVSWRRTEEDLGWERGRERMVEEGWSGESVRGAEVEGEGRTEMIEVERSGPVAAPLSL